MNRKKKFRKTGYAAQIKKKRRPHTSLAYTDKTAILQSLQVIDQDSIRKQ